MNLLRWFRRVRKPSPSVTLRTPQVGDPVWWAAKQEKCVVTKVQSDGTVAFQGGPLVRRPSGKVVPRWTATTGGASMHWSDRLEVWVVGEGRLPKNVRGTVIEPDPVNASVGTHKGRLF